MKKFLPLMTIAVCAVLANACSSKKGSDYKIYPLSPFTDAMHINNKPAAGQDFVPEIKTQYYIVEEGTDLTDKTRIMLENYIDIHLKKAISTNKAIYFTFYKGGFTFSHRSVQTKEQLHDEHAKDKLAEFEYKDGKLYNFDFYKNGTYYTQSAEAERGRPLNGKDDGGSQGGQ